MGPAVPEKLPFLPLNEGDTLGAVPDTPLEDIDPETAEASEDERTEPVPTRGTLDML